MTELDRGPFAEAMYALAETFNETISAVRTEAYFNALDDFSMAQINGAVLMALRTCTFFPKPVELRTLITGKSEDNADAAWAELIREVRRVGYIGTPEFSDGRTLRAICETWGTWPRLCETLPGEGPELIGWMKQFKAAFQSGDARDTTKLLTHATIDPSVRRFIQNERRRLTDAKA